VDPIQCLTVEANAGEQQLKLDIGILSPKRNLPGIYIYEKFEDEMKQASKKRKETRHRARHMLSSMERN
jgi:hypothetical protein